MTRVNNFDKTVIDLRQRVATHSVSTNKIKKEEFCEGRVENVFKSNKIIQNAYNGQVASAKLTVVRSVRAFSSITKLK